MTRKEKVIEELLAQGKIIKCSKCERLFSNFRNMTTVQPGEFKNPFPARSGKRCAACDNEWPADLKYFD